MSWSQIKDKNIPAAGRNPVTVALALSAIASQPGHAAIIKLLEQPFLAGKIMARLSLNAGLFYTYLKMVEDVRQDVEKAKARVKASEEQRKAVLSALRAASQKIHRLASQA